MDVYYIGEQQKGYSFWIEAENNNLSYECTGKQDNNYILQKEDILIKNPEHLIVSLKETVNTENDLLNILVQIKKTLNNNIIIFAPGYSRSMAFIRSLIAENINSFVFSDNMGTQRREFAEILKTYVKQDPAQVKIEMPPPAPEFIPVKKVAPAIEPAPKIEVIKPEIYQENRPIISKKKIAIIGSMPRIGTTTVALQMTAYFNSINMPSCYVERNNTGYIGDFLDIIEPDKHDEDMSEVVYKNIKMYYNPGKINTVLGMGYKNYIFDHGDIQSAGADIASVFEKDIIIAVCGIKASEMAASNKIIETLYDNTSTVYIFNSVSDSEKSDVLGMMDKMRSRVFFTDYSPDPFSLAHNNFSAFAKIERMIQNG